MTEIAIVTGTASGLGAATVRRLHAAGTSVVGIDLADAPEGDAAGPLEWVKGDICDAATWPKALAAAERLGGPPTAYIANAPYVVVGDALESTDEEWRRSFEVNLFGVLEGLRQVVPVMVAAGGGAIVTVTSVDAYMAEQHLAAYCASKGALLQLTKCLALDYARRGIRANSVCPGPMDTPLLRLPARDSGDEQGWIGERASRMPLGRVLDPGDVAEAVAFLAGPASRGMTGASVTVDAGLSVSFAFREELDNG